MPITSTKITPEMFIIACKALADAADVFPITETIDLLSKISPLVISNDNVLAELVTCNILLLFNRFCAIFELFVISNFVRYKKHAIAAMESFYAQLNMWAAAINIDTVEREWNKIPFESKVLLTENDLKR